MANRQNRSTRSINNFFRFVTLFPIIYFAVLVSVGALFIALYTNLEDALYFFIFLGFSVLMIVLYIVYTVYTTHRFQSVFFRGLYNVTIFNFKNISDNNNALINYPNAEYVEFNALNEQVDTLKSELDNATLISGTSDYAHINLYYLDIDAGIVSLSSFKNNLESILFASQNYRNVLIELFYELGDDDLDEKEINFLISLFKMNFHDYENTLYLLSEDHRSIFLYIPRIDSLSKIHEQLETMIRNATINKRTPDGVTNLAAHFAVVCYPFSDIHEFFPDLAYAKRQNLNINFYLPNRLNALQDNKILKNSMNLNTMSKILAPLLNVNLGLENSKQNIKEVQKVINEVRSAFSLDYAGIISYDEIKRFYYLSYQSQAKEAFPLSRDGHIEKEFIYAMDQAKDENNAYYFAFRNHANNALGRHLDRVGLESGFFYVLKDGDLAVGAIYFFNKNNRFSIDSYIQESLVVLCDKMAAIILGDRRDKEVESSYTEIDAILKIADYATYRVSHEDYTLLRASGTMKTLFPKLQIGEKCYKTLYGLDKPCPDCPLLTGNKKEHHHGKNNYETSLILSEHYSTYHVMTVKNIYNEESSSRYHKDLVINSYSSLVEEIENCYRISGKGYLLLLRVDNLPEMVEKLGSEGYLSILRDFIKRLKKLHNSLENVYFFSNQVIALLFKEYGQTDIIDECEKIFDLSVSKQENVDYHLSFTYLPVSYPRIFPNALALLKQAELFATRGKYAVRKDFIYFDESTYSRSANRDEFMLAVIDKAFGNKTFNVNLQPMVNIRSKRIYGAELLLRITDEYRNTVFRADQLVNVAAAHNKIGVISHALLDYIASIYEQYGLTIFNALGFHRLALNTDYSFFTDPNFYNDIHEYIKNLKLPNNFLAFEIPESDISNHVQEFREITRQLNSLHIVSVCDQYTGRYLSVEALKTIGFKEVKISRNVVNHIDSDRQRLNNIKQLLSEIKSHDMRASIVGVENIDQYLLLKDIDDTALLQGFYLYHPLEKQALIDAIRGANKVSDKDNN
ncbi:MAG: EAL domain-containing protein [Bacilli bacterium]|nr:EAL domain-containing protein [Bacilli bacterium]